MNTPTRRPTRSLTISAIAGLLLMPGLIGCRSDIPATADITPAPASISTVPGAKGIKVGHINSIHTSDPAFLPACMAFVEDIGETGKLEGLHISHIRGASQIRIDMREGKPEEYTLSINSDSIVIGASDAAGVGHALASLGQLIAQNSEGSLPAITVVDYPTWGYRGVMIDCSRHFRTVDELKRLVSAMSLLKLNVLHLHLTDNQGWRLYLDKHPEVTEKGTYYYDFPERSGQYYTPQELKELVEYASARSIEIIPEIDMPGHSLALLASHPGFSCRGGEFETYQDEREQHLRKRLGENMLCVGNEAIYAFVGDVIDQLTDIFPSRMIHTGGDEVSTHIWQTCPRCMALHQREGMTDLNSLQDYFTRRVGEMVKERGRIMIGWEEINTRGAALDDNVITVWQRRPKDILTKAVERGLDVIMCPSDPCYFDYSYTRNPSRKVYGWDLTYGQTDSLTLSHIKGAQVCLWTEFIPDASDMMQMLFPRVCAFAENLWSPAAKHDFADYSRRQATLVPLLHSLGIDTFNGENPEADWFRADSVSADSAKMPVRSVIETNMYSIRGYEKEYAFDGDTTTFYASPYSHIAGDYFRLVFDTMQPVVGIEVLADRSRAFFNKGTEMNISADGQTYETVAVPDAAGQLKVNFDTVTPVKALEIRLTKSKNSRLDIKEIILK